MAYHLEGEANQLWQWLRKAYREEGRNITWETFIEELWASFRPPEGVDFDEALSKLQQVGSLRDYQKEFERLGNQVQGWSQRVLDGTFMGGLKPKIAEAVQMFRPRTLKDAISLARMKDEQLQRQRGAPSTLTKSNLSTLAEVSNSTIKKLSWDEMQRRRT